MIYSSHSAFLTFVLEDGPIRLDEMDALFDISSLYTVKYVSAANGTHRHRMHDDERTDAARSCLPRIRNCTGSQIGSSNAAPAPRCNPRTDLILRLGATGDGPLCQPLTAGLSSMKLAAELMEADHAQGASLVTADHMTREVTAFLKHVVPYK